MSATAMAPRKALDDVSFTVAQGPFCVLLGLNGAGKSTLFSLMTRLFALRKGALRCSAATSPRQPRKALAATGRGVPVAHARSRPLAWRRIFFTTPHCTASARRRPRARTQELLEAVGLADRAGEKVRNLSGGQMRRVEIARALLHRPRLLVLDEPTVGLDIGARADILKLVRGLIASEGMSVLWATHLTDEVCETDDVIVLHKGFVLRHRAGAGVAATNRRRGHAGRPS